MHVAGVALVPDGTYANLWFVHVFFFETGRVQHGLRSALNFGLRESAVVIITDRQKLCCEMLSKSKYWPFHTSWSSMFLYLPTPLVQDDTTVINFTIFCHAQQGP